MERFKNFSEKYNYDYGTPESVKLMKKDTPGQNVKEKKRSKADDDAVKAFLAKGGKIKKLPPGRAQGSHGKDDPGKGMAGMLDKGDTKKFGTRKKVKSMRENLMLKNPYKGLSKSDLKKKEGSFKRQVADLQNKRLRSKMGAGKNPSLDKEIDKYEMKLKLVQKAMKEGVDQDNMHCNNAGCDCDPCTCGPNCHCGSLKEEQDPSEYDEEGMKMKDHLDIIMDAADEIYDIVEDNDNMPEWCQNKITKATDYVDSVRDYLMSKETNKEEE